MSCQSKGARTLLREFGFSTAEQITLFLKSLDARKVKDVNWTTFLVLVCETHQLDKDRTLTSHSVANALTIDASDNIILAGQGSSNDLLGDGGDSGECAMFVRHVHVHARPPWATPNPLP